MHLTSGATLSSSDEASVTQEYDYLYGAILPACSSAVHAQYAEYEHQSLGQQSFFYGRQNTDHIHTEQVAPCRHAIHQCSGSYIASNLAYKGLSCAIPDKSQNGSSGIPFNLQHPEDPLPFTGPSVATSTTMVLSFVRKFALVDNNKSMTTTNPHSSFPQSLEGSNAHLSEYFRHFCQCPGACCYPLSDHGKLLQLQTLCKSVHELKPFCQRDVKFAEY